MEPLDEGKIPEVHMLNRLLKDLEKAILGQFETNLSVTDFGSISDESSDQESTSSSPSTPRGSQLLRTRNDAIVIDRNFALDYFMKELENFANFLDQHVKQVDHKISDYCVPEDDEQTKKVLTEFQVSAKCVTSQLLHISLILI